MEEKERKRFEMEFKRLRELGQAENEALNRLIKALSILQHNEVEKNTPKDKSKTLPL